MIHKKVFKFGDLHLFLIYVPLPGYKVIFSPKAKQTRQKEELYIVSRVQVGVTLFFLFYFVFLGLNGCVKMVYQIYKNSQRIDSFCHCQLLLRVFMIRSREKLIRVKLKVARNSFQHLYFDGSL